MPVSRGGAKMPRFYFHFASKTDKINDDIGIDLEGPDAAHGHALNLIRKTALAIIGEPWHDWVVEVTGVYGQSVLIVPFHLNIPTADGCMSHHGSASGKGERLMGGGSAKLPKGE
jgi:hypothetical protein